MRLSVDASELAPIAAFVARHAGERATLPVLSGVILTAEGDALTLTASNLEVSATASLAAAVDADGSCIVPAALLAALAKRCDGKTRLELNEDNLSVDGGPSYRLRTIPNDNYPQLPSVDTDAVECDALTEALNAVAGAANVDEHRYQHLISVHFYAADERLLVEATDSYRLHQRVVGWAGGPVDVIVPLLAARSAAKLERPLSMAADDHSVLLAGADGARLTSRLVEGSFPATSTLVPNTDDCSPVVVDAGELRDAVADVVPVAEHTSTGAMVTLNISDVGSIKVTAGTGDRGEATAELACEASESLSLSFNSRYLSEAVASVEADRVTLWTRDNLKPVVARPSDDEHDRLALVMPVRVP